MGNWDNKEERAKKAKEHTAKVGVKYGDEICSCVNSTVVIDSSEFQQYWEKNVGTEIKLTDDTSTEAIFNEKEGKTAVLNFASFCNAGGRYLDGSSAQEECLCESSFLYNVLENFELTYYNLNRRDKNRNLYHNRGLYSPDVRFFQNGKEELCDVITLAAPNYGAARRFSRVTKEENERELYLRCLMVMFMAEKMKVDTLILGAYGCGVFKQDPNNVANYFKNILYKYGSNCKKIVFAIPDKESKNYLAFLNAYHDIKSVRDIV